MEIEKIAKEHFEVQLSTTLFSDKYTLSMDDGEKCVKLHLSVDDLLKIQHCINDFVSISPELQIAYTGAITLSTGTSIEGDKVK